MALVLANRVQETATPNTTVSFTLTGAVSGFQTFAVIGNTNTTYYSATDTAGNWEVGEGTYSTTGPTLARTTVYASSNSGSAVTFPGSVNVFVTYPSGKSVNLDGSGNVSALGTVTSGTWQGSTVGVAYGGTGVTSSSGPNSVVLRDANENITVNRINQGLQTVTATGGVTILTVASQFNQALVGAGNHTFRLPDATTLSATTAFQFNNNATGTLTIQNNAGTTVGTIAPGGAAGIALLSNATVGGTWDVHAYIPENVTWGTNALALGSTVISGGTWQGGTIQSGYGGTGLTTFTGANNALYSTSASALTAGTLPVVAGGTGQTSYTNGQLLIGNTTGNTLTKATLTAGTGICISNGAGSITISSTASVSCATPIVAGKVFGKTEAPGLGGRVALGYNAGLNGQYCNAIAIGVNAGSTNQPIGAIAVGANAAVVASCPFMVYTAPIAAGFNSYAQDCGVAVGYQARAGSNSVAIGPGSGIYCGGPISSSAVTIGAGTQAFNSTGAVALGNFNSANCAPYGVSIGYGAFVNAPNSIVINATGSPLCTFTSNQTHIAPIRSVCSTTGLTSLFYNSSTKEVVQAAGGGGVCCATPTVAGIVYGKTETFCCAGGITSLGYSSNAGCAGGVAVGASSTAANYGVAVGKCANAGYGGVSVGINASNSGFGFAVALGPCVSATGPCQTHISPIRSVCSTSGLQGLFYNACTKEVIRGTAAGGVCCATPTVSGKVYGKTEVNCTSQNTTLGFQSNVGGSNGTAIGFQANTFGSASVAIGSSAYTCFGASGAVAVGYQANSVASNGIAIGRGASAGNSGIAIGAFTTASSGSIVLNATGSAMPCVSPCRTYINPITYTPCSIGLNTLYYCGFTKEVFNGPAGGGGVCCATPTVAGKVYGRTDTVCGGNNTGLGNGINFGFANSCNVVIGNSSTWNRYAASCNVVIGAGANACCCAVRNVLVGKSASVYYGTACAVAIGKSSISSSLGVSIGANTVSGQNYNVAVGASAFSGTCSSIAIGRSASANYCFSFAPQAVVIGPFTFTNGATTVTIGAQASTFGSFPSVSDGAIAIGHNAQASLQNAIAIGKCSMANQTNSIAIGFNVGATGPCQTHIKPIRNAAGPFTLRYNPCSGEITYN